MQTVAKHAYAYLLLNIDKNVEECDARMINRSNTARFKILPYQCYSAFLKINLT
jgi:hypothetical protein